MQEILGDENVASTTGRSDRFGPGGVDLVVDVVGKAYFERNVRMITVRGRIEFLSALSGAELPLPFRALTSKRRELIGATPRA